MTQIAGQISSFLTDRDLTIRCELNGVKEIIISSIHEHTLFTAIDHLTTY